MWQLRDPLQFGNAAKLKSELIEGTMEVKPVELCVSLRTNEGMFENSMEIAAWSLLLRDLMQLYADAPWNYVDLARHIVTIGGDPMSVYDSVLCGKYRHLVDKCDRDPWLYRELRSYMVNRGDRVEFVRRLGFDGVTWRESAWETIG